MTESTKKLISAEQEAAIIDVKETLASKQDVLMAMGQIQAFNNIRKYATVAEIITFKKVKESKQYKGLIYKNDVGESATVADLEDVCKHFFKRSYRSMQEDLQSLEDFGQSFLESSQNMGLGYREMRKLRQLPEESQQLIINSKDVDLGDKEAVKELIEDEAVKHAKEMYDLQKEVKEANQTVNAIRANSDEKSKQLDEVKEREAKRRFSQEPWKASVLDHAKGMLEARESIQKGVDQLIDIFENFKNTELTLNEKATKSIGRSLMTEAHLTNDVVAAFTSEVFGLFGGMFESDLDAGEIFQEFELGIDPSNENIIETDTAE